MAEKFFFYDLETSGLSPKQARIMQFAGQHTDMNLKPIGEPVNQLIKLSPDVLPDPSAVLVTGITPQQTLESGLSEVEFLELFFGRVATKNTIFVGYNSIRFDDEFMRYLMWRNYYDPYEWQWKDGRGRWDLLDVVRMTRALRPDGINWPKDEQGKPANRLELLTADNKIEHSGAHDAMADVKATIDLARLIKSKQPKLFGYLLNHRDKTSVADVVNNSQPFLYSSGKFPSEFDKTTVAIKLADRPSGALVYDLRHDPSQFTDLSVEQLIERWQYTRDEDAPTRVPAKTIKFNRCPAIAPLGVLDKSSQKRLKLNLAEIETNLKKLAIVREFPRNLIRALDIMDKRRNQALASETTSAEERLYDGFISSSDKALLPQARYGDKLPNFSDARLNELWPRYRARNFPNKLTPNEQTQWQQYCMAILTDGGETSRLANYLKDIAARKNAKLTKNQAFLLEDLQLYGESLLQ